MTLKTYWIGLKNLNLALLTNDHDLDHSVFVVDSEGANLPCYTDVFPDRDFDLSDLGLDLFDLYDLIMALFTVIWASKTLIWSENLQIDLNILKSTSKTLVLTLLTRAGEPVNFLPAPAPAPCFF